MQAVTARAIGSSFTPPAIGAEQDERARAFEAMQRREEWRGRLRLSMVPRAFQQAKLSQCHPKVIEYAERFGEVRNGIDRKVHAPDTGLLLTGPIGSGKTTQACAVLNHAARFVTVLYAPMADFVEQAVSREGLSRYRNVRLLLLDDIGKERPTEYAMQNAYSVIDQRWREGKPTLFTTNHDKRGLMAHFASIADIHTAEAVMSRIIGMCEAVRIEGADRRTA